jgi:hypothetical protein
MTPQLVLIKTRLRLNKLQSNDYDNIEDWKVMEVVNKAQLEWFRRQVHGSNSRQEGDEQSRIRVDDLQKFLIERRLDGVSKQGYFQSNILPTDYLWFKKIMPQCAKDSCQGVLLDSTLIEEANVPTYLFDWSLSPSFEWRQTFHTLVGNKLRIYTADDFVVEYVKLMYYRMPQKVDVAGYTHENGVASVDMDLEFKDDVVELILDDAVSILAADTEYLSQMQVSKQRAEQNN